LAILREGAIVQRIFLGLAVLAVLLLAANVLIGLTGGDFNAVAHEYQAAATQIRELHKIDAPKEEIEAAEAKREKLFVAAKALRPQMTRHMLLGIASALVTLLVCSVSITYFVGTSKWFKEVVETYKLDPRYVEQSGRIKRRSFRWSVSGALAIVLVVGLGAASEPTWANAENSPLFVLPHYVASLVAVGFLLLSFYMQATALAENGRLIETVMGDVRRIRAERGLAVEPEPSHA
jgi:hypothetical protein